MKTLIKNGTIINEGRAFRGSVLIDGDRIEAVIEAPSHLPQPEETSNIALNNLTPHSTLHSPQDARLDSLAPRLLDSLDQRIDATGCYILPGVIDTHVHFREPGLTHKADIQTESRAAAYGGVTTFFDMPNTQPQTTTLEALEEKFRLAREKSHINYSFFFGATNDNYHLFSLLDRSRTPGVKLFMGSSTGNMLVDRYGSLLNIFREAARLDLQLMAHCEATDVINQNMADFQKTYGDDPPVMLHPLIRSTEACLESSALAAQLARQFGTRLHIAHVSTAEELRLRSQGAKESGRSGSQDNSNINRKGKECRLDSLTPCLLASLDKRVTFEACVAHLLFSSDDYAALDTRIKCNPAVKSKADRDALRRALTDGRIATIATDHAPHLLSEKQGGCRRAASGMPMIQFSLPAMLTLASEGVLPVERVVELMCHNPARLFRISERGFLRKGYKADVTIVRPTKPYVVSDGLVQSRCGWTPLAGRSLHWRVTHTFCNGHPVLLDGQFNPDNRGEEVVFSTLHP